MKFPDMLLRPIKIEKGSDLLKSVAKTIGWSFALNPGLAAQNLADAVGALGLGDTEEAAAVALLNAGLQGALARLVKDYRATLDWSDETRAQLEAQITQALAATDMELSQDFFANPAANPFFVALADALERELSNQLSAPAARSLRNRLPAYFALALRDVWARDAQRYQKLLSPNTPFDEVAERARAWDHYHRYLEQLPDESVFGLPFSLRQIYVPLRAYAVTGQDKRKREKRRVIDLQTAILTWLAQQNQQDAFRVICGGPGSGKSSFAKVLAAKVIGQGEVHVLLLPLYALRLQANLEQAATDYFKKSMYFAKHSPLDDKPLLLILDGLDELQALGKGHEQAAQDFVRHVQDKVTEMNRWEYRVSVVITGRDVVTRSGTASLRDPGVYLQVLPYWYPKEQHDENVVWDDSGRRLDVDQRDRWWSQYGKWVGRDYAGLPQEFSRKDLDDITAQPLLNLLLALSPVMALGEYHPRNRLYAHLIEQVYLRQWGRPHVAVDWLNSKDDFVRLLEEVALAAWQGNGRSVTMRTVELRLEGSSLLNGLQEYRKRAEEGAVRLLTAFYFREDDSIADEGRVFEFTHKSFAEYLAARGITEHLRLTENEMARHLTSRGGWSLDDALREWDQLFGEAPLTEEIEDFMAGELRDEVDALRMQQRVVELTRAAIAGKLPITNGHQYYGEAMRRAACAESALLRVLAVLSVVTGESPVLSGACSSRVLGHWLVRTLYLASCSGVRAVLNGVDINGADFPKHAILVGLAADRANFQNASLEGVNLADASLEKANFSYADLRGANLEGVRLKGGVLEAVKLADARLAGANLESAYLRYADLGRADLVDINLADANLLNAGLVGANLDGAELTRANFQGADLEYANLNGARLVFANLQGANLAGASLEGADLSGANLEGADLSGANLEDARLKDANLAGANLNGTILRH